MNDLFDLKKKKFKINEIFLEDESQYLITCVLEEMKNL